MKFTAFNQRPTAGAAIASERVALNFVRWVATSALQSHALLAACAQAKPSRPVRLSELVHALQGMREAELALAHCLAGTLATKLAAVRRPGLPRPQPARASQPHLFVATAPALSANHH